MVRSDALWRLVMLDGGCCVLGGLWSGCQAPHSAWCSHVTRQPAHPSQVVKRFQPQLVLIQYLDQHGFYYRRMT